MKNMQEFVQRTGKIKLSSKDTKKLVSRLVREAFDKKDLSEDRAKELIVTAYVWRLDCLNEMLEDYDLLTFKF